jgi:hypothetical protein
MLNVEVVFGVMLLAVCAVTPLGAPDTLSVKGVVKVPCVTAHETPTLAACPAVSETVVGLAVRPQSGCAVTAKVNEMVLLTQPPAAVTVIVEVPALAVLVAVKVSVLEPPAVPLRLAGENAAVTPAGTPAIERATAELNPF